MSDTRVRMLTIRARELDWLITNSRLVAQLAALLAGYGYTALIYTKYLDDPSLCDRNDPLCAEMTYPLCVTITMGFSMFALFVSMLITLLAPALALRGPQGSLNLCVDMVLQEYTYALLLFAAAVLMLLVSTVVWSMTRANANPLLVWAASLITLISLAAVGLTIATSMRAVRRFDIPAGSRLVTGRFNVDEAEREEERLRLAAVAAIAQQSAGRVPSSSQANRSPNPLSPDRARGGHPQRGSASVTAAAPAAEPMDALRLAHARSGAPNGGTMPTSLDEHAQARSMPAKQQGAQGSELSGAFPHGSRPPPLL